MQGKDQIVMRIVMPIISLLASRLTLIINRIKFIIILCQCLILNH